MKETLSDAQNGNRMRDMLYRIDLYSNHLSGLNFSYFIWKETAQRVRAVQCEKVRFLFSVSHEISGWKHSIKVKLRDDSRTRMKIC